VFDLTGAGSILSNPASITATITESGDWYELLVKPLGAGADSFILYLVSDGASDVTSYAGDITKGLDVATVGGFSSLGGFKTITGIGKSLVGVKLPKASVKMPRPGAAAAAKAADRAKAGGGTPLGTGIVPLSSGGGGGKGGGGFFAAILKLFGIG